MANDSTQRDRAMKLAQADANAALDIAEAIGNALFRAQAYGWIIRFHPSRARDLTIKATRAAARCSDAFERVAARAWIVAALAEIDQADAARESVQISIVDAQHIPHPGSRAEALMLLLQAAGRIDDQQQRVVFNEIKKACEGQLHWRCERALKDAAAICAGTQSPRDFFR